MGVSTNAIFCFGFQIPGEGEGSLEEFFGEEISIDYEEFLEEIIIQEYCEISGNKDEEVDLVLLEHCSCDCPQYILAIGSSVTTATCGWPEKLGKEIIGSQKWRTLLFDFCEKMNLKFEEPEFLICSYWS